jgi:hypothetical protein
MNSLVTKISEVNQEVIQGIHSSFRDNDMLTQALGTKEHGGHSRGSSTIPWELAFDDELVIGRSCSKGKATKELQAKRALKEMEANFDKQVEEKVKEKVKEMLASKGAKEPVGTSSIP